MKQIDTKAIVAKARKAKRNAIKRELADIDSQIEKASKNLMLLVYDRKCKEINTIKRKTDRKKAMASLFNYVMGA